MSAAVSVSLFSSIGSLATSGGRLLLAAVLLLATARWRLPGPSRRGRAWPSRSASLWLR